MCWERVLSLGVHFVHSFLPGAYSVALVSCHCLYIAVMQNRALALAVYNSFMHIGRALSFAALALASGMDHSTGYDGQPKALLVPMDQLDLSKVSVLYVQGDLIAITPVYDYAKYSMDGITVSPEAVATWRSVLTTMVSVLPLRMSRR